MCNLSNFQYTMEELNMIMDMVKQEMDAAIKHLDHAFQKIRAGRASTSMVQDCGRILRSNVANQSSCECICSRCDDDFYSTMG